MKSTYDAIVLGLGLKEAVISTKLSLQGLSVLQVLTESTNNTLQMNLELGEATQDIIHQSHKNTKVDCPCNWIIDTLGHLIMENGKFWEFLAEIDILDDICASPIDRTFYYKDSHLVYLPSTMLEIMTSQILGPIEKVNLTKLFTWIGEFRQEDPRTFTKVFKGGLTTEKFDVVLKKFSLTSKHTQMMIYHIICNYSSQIEIDKASALDVIARLKVYISTLTEDNEEPFHYPVYGMDQILLMIVGAAVINGAEKVNNSVKGLLYDSSNKVCGVEFVTGQRAYSKSVICNATHVPKMVMKVSSVIRAICLLDHKLKETDSFQIIIPHHKYNRQHNINVLGISQKHKVAPKTSQLVYITTVVETKDPKSELDPALKILGKILKITYQEYPITRPLQEDRKRNMIILKEFQGAAAFDDMMEEIEEICKYFQ